ncbi:MAG: sensor histidine kinase [Anaerolineae bacterium]|nr:sensor histidine kinase [Anaerolineae bacterium]
MLHKLQTQLVVSHALPLIVLSIILYPVILYLLETRYSIDNLRYEMEQQGNLILELGKNDVTGWNDLKSAERMIDRVRPYLRSRVMILDKDGVLLASSLPSDDNRKGKVIHAGVVLDAMEGHTAWDVDYNSFMQARIVDVARPISDPAGGVIGVLRFSHDVTEIEQSIIPLRTTVIIAFGIGLATALAVGLFFAQSLSLPLQRLKAAVTALAPGSVQASPLPEHGPDEVRTIATSYNQLLRHLRKMEAERRQLLANIVHELGTPLGAVKAATQALQRGAINDLQFAQDLVVGINSQIDQLSLLVDDLSLLGETEIREPVIRREWIDLKALVVVKCSAYQPLIADKRITLIYHLPDEPLSIYADEIRVAQILANLIQNAFKYTPSNGQIDISVEKDNQGTKSFAVLRVKDTGPGIAADEQEAIFQIQYRSPRQRHIKQGMGIGLAVAHRLSEAHGGTLAVTSELGAGATFTLRLPI